MQDRPKAEILLEAIQDFLMKEIMPYVKNDDALSYKTLVSWNMLGVVSREIKYNDDLLEAELARLVEILKTPPPPADSKERMEVLAKLNSQLIHKIRKEKISDNGPAWNHVKKTLEEKIRISNPRFNTE